MTPHDKLPHDEWFDPQKRKTPSEDAYSSRFESTPDTELPAEEVVTIHERMYRFATEKGTDTLSLGGGSEEIQS